jgi:hypothetical protein
MAMTQKPTPTNDMDRMTDDERKSIKEGKTEVPAHGNISRQVTPEHKGINPEQKGPAQPHSQNSQ